MPLGCEEDGRFYCGRKKEPSSHVYMCRIEQDGRYDNTPTHALNHTPYIGLMVLSCVEVILIDGVLMQITLD